MDLDVSEIKKVIIQILRCNKETCVDALCSGYIKMSVTKGIISDNDIQKDKLRKSANPIIVEFIWDLIVKRAITPGNTGNPLDTYPLVRVTNEDVLDEVFDKL